MTEEPRPETLAEKTARLRALRLAREAESPVRKAPERRFPVVGLDDELAFGRHRGRMLRDVIERDPGWVEWAVECIGTFEISDEAAAELAAASDPRRPPRAWE